MPRLRSLSLVAALGICLALALPAQASGLTGAQISAILAVLTSFGADAPTVAKVDAALHGTTFTNSPTSIVNSPTTVSTVAPAPPTVTTVVAPQVAQTTAQTTTTTTTSTRPWANLYGKMGSDYLQTTAEINALASAGFNLLLAGYKATTPGLFKDAISLNRIALIDVDPQYEIYSTCHFSGGTCPLADQQIVLANVKAHLDSVANDPNIVGFWVLDDYPGADLKPLLRQIHQLIAASNLSAPKLRAAICGFGGYLDIKSSPTASFISTDNYASIDTAVTNFDPQACDVVAVYGYGENTQNDASLVDWSMSTFLPRALASLRAKGWDQSKQPLIGMPQAFGYPSSNPQIFYPVPSAANVATQTEAYCKSSAASILFFSWDDGYTGTKSEPFNTPSLVQGLQQGMQACKNYWSVAPIQPVTITTTPISTPTTIISPTPPPIVPTTISPDAAATRNAERRGDLIALKTALERYRTDHGSYPSTNGKWWSSATSDYTLLGISPLPAYYISGLAPTYIAQLPKDPQGGLADASRPACGAGWARAYVYQSNGTQFKLLAHCGPEGTWTASDSMFDPQRPSWAWTVCGGETICNDLPTTQAYNLNSNIRFTAGAAGAAQIGFWQMLGL